MAVTGLTKITMPIVKLTKNGIRFLGKNSNVILTIVGATGVIASVAFAINGTIKAVRLCEEKQVTDGKEVIKTVWKCYIPTLGLVILTTTAIICNGRINAKKLAVLTSAYSGTVEAVKKIEEKMTEQIGPKKTQKAMDEANAAIAQNHAPENKDDIIATGKGNQLFYLRSTGQWFYSSRDGVDKAEVKCQKDIMAMQNRGFGEYYMAQEVLENLGIEEKTEFGEYMGWDIDDFKGGKEFHFIVSSDWMDLPWGKEVVGIVNFDPWPVNI